jgi:hypothetical protein
MIGVDSRVTPVIRVPAIDTEFLPIPFAVRSVPGLAFGNFRILRKCELNHGTAGFPAIEILALLTEA